MFPNLCDLETSRTPTGAAKEEAKEESRLLVIHMSNVARQFDVSRETPALEIECGRRAGNTPPPYRPQKQYGRPYFLPDCDIIVPTVVLVV